MKTDRAIHVVVFDDFADWEPAYALAELRRRGKRTIRTLGFTPAPVTSMGGLRITPDLELSAVDAADVELLILPGGDVWEGEAYPRKALEALLDALVTAQTPIAAICAGTLVLGRAGLLDDRNHTSNSRRYLSGHAAEYAGGSHYVEAPAVTDRHVITASGLAAVDFARGIFAELEIFNAADERLWFDMFKHGRHPEVNSRGDR